MEIISQGEKIKRLRKMIGLKQEDLASHKITRSLISMIENGKRGLTFDTANIIVQKLNKYSNSFDKPITVEYLMETEVDQAKYFANYELIRVDKLILESAFSNYHYTMECIENTTKIIELWKLNEYLPKLHVLKGKLYYNTHQYDNARESFQEAICVYSNEENHEEISSLYNLLGKCYFTELFIDKAVYFFQKSYEIATINKCCREIRMMALFNLVLSYYEAKQYNTSLKYISKYMMLNENRLSSNTYDELLIIEASIYSEIGNSKGAEDIFSMLLNRRDSFSTNTLALLYLKLSIFYRQDSNYKNSLLYIKRAMKLKDGIIPTLVPKIYVALAEYHIEMKQYNGALIVLQEAKGICEVISNNEGLIDVFFLKASIYMKIGEGVSLAEAYLKKAEAIILGKAIIIRVKLQQLYSYYTELYYITQNADKFYQYNEMIRNLSIF
ncbi:helix-turn-helix transcriptional regulator [Alkaliphilus pronyensis]|uniref:Helix-turn-helix transcriptional regulator n=1 Tax=Alkaliphilus pronyensis TaxID=1482732 RepID=A0A6I0F552_9FIRM|nr:helix-turn-helix transcriptional regulator [Alkaliphilus pronyensis]KAB3537700.1 helix-turn-helix transcriptional regulator [Alkaliphilus pronyensis]